ncbi:hypothetical protein BDR06DRAFT_969977 [Suillus hirtellus]|nr:hypothetical protein BDR06DRAFT_969977 [Suillus hirtellus]
MVTIAPSILTDVEIETDPSIPYPTLEVFMVKLDNEEPGQRWSEIFLPPLRWMGVRTIDDMCIVLPKSLAGKEDYNARIGGVSRRQSLWSLEAPLSSTDCWVVKAQEKGYGVGGSLEAPPSSIDCWVVQAQEKGHDEGVNVSIDFRQNGLLADSSRSHPTNY